MIERVARALCEADKMLPDVPVTVDPHALVWTLFIPAARAAIEAMRITEDAPAGNAFDNAFALVKSDWNAAIDAALRPSI